MKSLKEEFPDINTFSTLSPIPGFRSWLLGKIQSTKRADGSEILKPTEKERLQPLLESFQNINKKNDIADPESDFYDRMHHVISSNAWVQDEALAAELQTPLMRLCAQYLYIEKRRNLALDSVANFHLRNGASMWRINWLADMSPRGLTNSCALMVNYRYFLESLEDNSASYQESFHVTAGDQVIQLATQAKSLT